MTVHYPIKTLEQLRPIMQGFRKTAGLTQAAMAARLGVTQQTYSQLEANPASASMERLFRVFLALGVEVSLSARKEKGGAEEIERSAPSGSPREDW